MAKTNFSQVVEQLQSYLHHTYGQRCTKCNQRTRPHPSRPFTVVCTWKQHCGSTRSLLQGTLLEGWKKPKETFVKIIECLFTFTGLATISRLVDYDKDSLKNLVRKLHQNARDRYYNAIPVIGGPNIIVEADESKFGKRKHHRGHRVEGVWVYGMVERTPERRIVLIPVPNRTKDTLTRLTTAYMESGSVFFSDCWKGYAGIRESFAHYTVNHSKWFKCPETGVHTNTIEGNWAPLKAGIPKRWRTEEKIWLPLLMSMIKRNSTNGEALLEFIKHII